MNACLILNDGARSFDAGGKSLAASAVIDAFRSTGLSLTARIAPGAELDETVRAVVAERPEAIVIGGGDGSVSTAAQCLADTGIALGVLPLGTLNHFARDLGLPLDWREAVEALARGERRAIDVAEVNGRVFINNCSVGAYAEAVRKRDALRRMRGTGKWWAMTIATMAVFRRLRRIRVRVTTGGETRPLRTPFIVVSNNQYTGHVLDYSLRPRLDAGRLWIYSTRAHRHGAILRFIWQSLLRNIDEVDGLDQMASIEATLEHDHPRLPVAIDGELANMPSPLRFRLRAGALQVLAPHGRSLTGHENDRPRF